ncbi:trypsin-like peptidase domain-containing protein [bacterium]|nr:trypsin-like peptidase domain-containing protein [bacterium]
MDKAGIVLTNSHVVFGKQAIMVTLDKGQVIVAQLVGLDPQLDLAVLKIELPGNGWTTIPLADENEQQDGVEVLAIGFPLGLGQTVTRGIISGVNRVLPTSPMSYTVPMIQTDASINPGNSGGPLINLCGEVVGMNSAGFVGAENVGFALPSTIISAVYPLLVRDGRVIKPWIGVGGKLIRKKEIQNLFNLDVVDGFLIEIVEPGSPAEAAKIQGGLLPIKVANEEFLFGGDIVTAVNGKSFSDPNNYIETVKNLKVGVKIQVDLYRSGKRLSVTIQVPERPILPWDVPFDDRCR